MAVLAVGLLAFFFRRFVQDHERLKWREEVPSEPDAETAKAFEDMGVSVGSGALAGGKVLASP
jgi:hypothetical protein